MRRPGERPAGPLRADLPALRLGVAEPGEAARGLPFDELSDVVRPDGAFGSGEDPGERDRQGEVALGGLRVVQPGQSEHRPRAGVAQRAERARVAGHRRGGGQGEHPLRVPDGDALGDQPAQRVPEQVGARPAQCVQHGDGGHPRIAALFTTPGPAAPRDPFEDVLTRALAGVLG